MAIKPKRTVSIAQRMSAIRPSSKTDWTSARVEAVVFAPSRLPGIAGLYSVQGEGLAFVCRVEKTMTINPKSNTKVQASKLTGQQLTRQQQLAKLLCRKSGASVAQSQKAFGWQPHTARAAISALRKGGMSIERTDAGKGSVYRAPGEA